MCRIEPGIDLFAAPVDGTIRPLLRLVAIRRALIEFGGGGGGVAFDGPAMVQQSFGASSLTTFDEAGRLCMFFSSILGSK